MEKVARKDACDFIRCDSCGTWWRMQGGVYPQYIVKVLKGIWVLYDAPLSTKQCVVGHYCRTCAKLIVRNKNRKLMDIFLDK